MSGDVNTDTNQTSTTIRLPDETGVENPPSTQRGGKASSQEPDEPKTPDEHVPPVEVPGRQDVPEHVPEKSAARENIFPFRSKQ